jgi:hypothetical protein
MVHCLSDGRSFFISKNYVFAIDGTLLEQQPEGISIKNDSLYKYYVGSVPS